MTEEKIRQVEQTCERQVKRFEAVIKGTVLENRADLDFVLDRITGDLVARIAVQVESTTVDGDRENSQVED